MGVWQQSQKRCSRQSSFTSFQTHLLLSHRRRVANSCEKPFVWRYGTAYWSCPTCKEERIVLNLYMNLQFIQILSLQYYTIFYYLFSHNINKLRRQNIERMKNRLIKKYPSSRSYRSSDEPTKIKDGLFVGNQSSANDLHFMKTNKISHIINTVGHKVPNFFTKSQIRYLSLYWAQNEAKIFGDLETDQNIPSTQFQEKIKPLNQIVGFIQEAVDNGSSLLIHSIHGNSRACFIVVAYFMAKYCWNLNKSLEFLRISFPKQAIKPIFLSQLETLQNFLSSKHVLSCEWVLVDHPKQNSEQPKQQSEQKCMNHTQNQTKQQLVLVNTYKNIKIGKTFTVEPLTKSVKNSVKKVKWQGQQQINITHHPLYHSIQVVNKSINTNISSTGFNLLSSSIKNINKTEINEIRYSAKKLTKQPSVLKPILKQTKIMEQQRSQVKIDLKKQMIEFNSYRKDVVKQQENVKYMSLEDYIQFSEQLVTKHSSLLTKTQEQKCNKKEQREEERTQTMKESKQIDQKNIGWKRRSINIQSVPTRQEKEINIIVHKCYKKINSNTDKSKKTKNNFRFLVEQMDEKRKKTEQVTKETNVDKFWDFNETKTQSNYQHSLKNSASKNYVIKSTNMDKNNRIKPYQNIINGLKNQGHVKKTSNFSQKNTTNSYSRKNYGNHNKNQAMVQGKTNYFRSVQYQSQTKRPYSLLSSPHKHMTISQKTIQQDSMQLNRNHRTLIPQKMKIFKQDQKVNKINIISQIKQSQNANIIGYTRNQRRVYYPQSNSNPIRENLRKQNSKS